MCSRGTVSQVKNASLKLFSSNGVRLTDYISCQLKEVQAISFMTDQQCVQMSQKFLFTEFKLLTKKIEGTLYRISSQYRVMPTTDPICDPKAQVLDLVSKREKKCMWRTSTFNWQ